MGAAVMQRGCGGRVSCVIALAVLLSTGADGARYEDSDAADTGSGGGLEAAAVVFKADASGASMDLRWKCDKIEKKEVISAATYCFAISAIASHCFAVVHFQGGAALLELNGVKGSPDANLGCYDLGTIYYKSATLKKASRMKTKDTGFAWLQQPAKRVGKCIGGWKDRGYTDACYEPTMAGVKKWAEDYLKEFPAYSVMSTNCQKFSVGLYNAMTHSHESERQRTGMAILKNFNWAIGASVESVESLTGKKGKEEQEEEGKL